MKASTPNERRSLILEVEKPSELLERYYPNGREGGITLDGPAPGAVGLYCQLHVHIAQPERRRFTLNGQLAWARHKASPGMKQCYGIDFVDEPSAARRLLQYAREEVGPEQSRIEDRVHTTLSVKLIHQGRARREQLADLSSHGAFVRSEYPLAPGEPVELVIKKPRSLFGRVRVRGQVAWARQATGDNDSGMGIAFIFDGAAEPEALRKLLTRLRREELERAR